MKMSKLPASAIVVSLFFATACLGGKNEERPASNANANINTNTNESASAKVQAGAQAKIVDKVDKLDAGKLNTGAEKKAPCDEDLKKQEEIFKSKIETPSLAPAGDTGCKIE